MGQTTEQTAQTSARGQGAGPLADGPAVRLPASARYAGGAGPGGREGLHVVAANNRFARVVLTFAELRPGAAACLRFGLAGDGAEAAGLSPDWAAAGFDFLAADGSSLDLDGVPGLARSLVDPHVAWIPGPALQGPEPGPRIAFRVPEQARAVAVTLRSWRNRQPFTVSDPALLLGEAEPGAAPTRRRLDAGPFPLRYALAADIALVLRGQVFAERADEHAARVRLVYRDAEGAAIAPPYPACVSVPGLGAVINLPAQPQARRFTLTLRPPTGAALLDLDFAPWEDAETPPTVELTAAPEIALEDDFRLESLCGDDPLDAPAFLARLAGRLGLPGGAEAEWLAPEAGEGLPLLARIRALRAGPDRSARRDGAGGIVLGLAGLPDWTLPEAGDPLADPFRSVAWRLAYQSLSWLLPLAGLPEGLPQARALACAWSEANPWGHPADPLSLHPAALAPRADVLAGLLAGEGDALRDRIAAEAARHGFALAEIVGQNTLARTLHGVQAAAALFGLARALPRFPFSAHWDSLARESLREGFASLLGADGRFADAAPVRRLDLVGHAQAVAAALGAAAPGPEVGARAAAALPGLAGLLDPTGRLPPFGDAPAGLDHAAWIARLRGPEGSDLVAAREALPEPEAESADILTLRYDGPDRGWGYFACLAAAQSPAGHRDCTSFVYAAEGRRWIVEGGGAEGAESGAARHYLLSPRAHNVAIPDGREPVAGQGRLAERFSLDGARIVALTTDVHGPDYAHARVFVVLDDLRGLAVIDRFARPGAEGQALSFEGLLHLPPDSLVALSGPRRALAQQEGRRIEFLPWTVAGQPAGLDVVVGRSDRPGAMHGFVATGAGGLKAAPVLRYAFSGRGTVCGGIVIATEAEAEARLVRLLAAEPVRRLTA